MRSNPYLDGTYLEQVRDWHAGDSPWKASKVFQLIQKHGLHPQSVYDVGCGAGEILVELQKKMEAGVKFAGFDISPQAISLAEAKSGSQIAFSNTDFLTAQVLPPDLILLLDVFEHVADYLGFLDALRKKAAWMIVHIPLDINAKAVLRKSKGMLEMRAQYAHLHYFTKETALATLADTGYEIIDVVYTDDFEITDRMIPRKVRSRIAYEVRRFLFRLRRDWAVSIFDHFNALVLVRGDRAESRF